MLKLWYVGCLGLSPAILAQFTLEVRVAAQNRKKFTKTPYFGGSKSFKVIDVYISKKLVASVCYDKQCSCIDVSMELLRRTWWTVAHSQQKSLGVNICVLPLSGSWSYRAIDWTVSVVGAFLWRARRLGIRYQTVFVTQNWVSILSNVSWRHTFLRNIDDKMY